MWKKEQNQKKLLSLLVLHFKTLAKRKTLSHNWTSSSTWKLISKLRDLHLHTMTHYSPTASFPSQDLAFCREKWSGGAKRDSSSGCILYRACTRPNQHTSRHAAFEASGSAVVHCQAWLAQLSEHLLNPSFVSEFSVVPCKSPPGSPEAWLYRNEQGAVVVPNAPCQGPPRASRPLIHHRDIPVSSGVYFQPQLVREILLMTLIEVWSCF